MMATQFTRVRAKPRPDRRSKHAIDMNCNIHAGKGTLPSMGSLDAAKKAPHAAEAASTAEAAVSTGAATEEANLAT